MITVCGETVADLVEQGDGDLRAYPGGSPANVAVALARLGEATSLAARLGPDVFGRRMRSHLADNGVDPRHLVEAAEPSTLAVVSFDDERRATYDFWTQGTADWQWSDADLARHPAPGVVAWHTGSLASWTAPGDAAIHRLFERVRASDACTLSYDPNVRPLLLGDAGAARGPIEWLVSLAHVVKVSDEDLGWLCPGEDVATIAQQWARLGPGLVVVTLGPDGALAARPERGVVVRVAAPSIDLVDTVGAGDTFTAGLLHALRVHDALGADPLGRLRALSDEDLSGVLDRATNAAALNCTREGCDPPTRAELDGFG
ncbi:MAG TPA: carbohydrate kinase [Ornithinibacter sp.]|nr:carbohydrate kinase [Ornithinibacter sp.]